MFTGIIEAIGTIRKIEKEGSNVHFSVESKIAPELKVDQSVSHNGVCLTVTYVHGMTHKVTAVLETLQKSNLGSLKLGDEVNLERCMRIDGRLDGHIVQGHVDQTAACIKKETLDGSWVFTFEYDEKPGNVTVEKGSICIDGVSLTCFNTQKNRFSVAIIPFTMEHTIFKNLKIHDKVNLEFDIIGKYVSKLLNKN